MIRPRPPRPSMMMQRTMESQGKSEVAEEFITERPEENNITQRSLKPVEGAACWTLH